MKQRSIIKPTLTEKQRNFVKEYVLSGGNLGISTLKAGYETTSENGAKAIGHGLIKHEGIRQAIRDLQKQNDLEFMRKLNITYEWKIRKLKQIVDEYIPESGLTHVERTRIGIEALKEMNKMMGDYAPDKRLSITVDATKDKLKATKKVYKEF